MPKRRANGEGNIRKRKDGRWEGRYTAGYDANGKAITKNVLGKTQAEVKDKLRAAIEDSKKLDPVKAGSYTLEQWLKLWYSVYVEPQVRYSTKEFYHNAIDHHIIPKLGSAKLEKLTMLQIQQFYNELLKTGRVQKKNQPELKEHGLSPRMVQCVHVVLNKALEHAVVEKLILANPAKKCTLAGLSAINRESKDAIRSAVNELEKAGYIRRRQTVDRRGKFSGNEYIIYEQPQPSSASPSSGFPTTGNPSTEKPSSENPTQLKIDQVNIQEENTKGSNTHSILSGTPDVKRSEMNRSEIEQYRALIEENIDYDILLEEMPYEQERLEEIVGLMTDTVCSSRSHIRVAGSDFPAEVVKSRLLKLNAEHIRFVFDCLKKNTTEIRNTRNPRFRCTPMTGQAQTARHCTLWTCIAPTR